VGKCDAEMRKIANRMRSALVCMFGYGTVSDGFHIICSDSGQCVIPVVKVQKAE
jgi:hypothetical protein